MKRINNHTIAAIAMQQAADKGICGIAKSMARTFIETQNPLKCLDSLRSSWTAQPSAQHGVEFNFGECLLECGS